MSAARRAERWGFALGVAGTLVLVAGDQLLYWAPVSGAEFAGHFRAIVAAAPTGRVLLGARLGPLGGCLYLAGFAALWSRLRHGQPVLAAAIGCAFTFFIVAGSTYHTLWGPHALMLQAVARAGGPAAAELTVVREQAAAFGRSIFRMAEVAGWSGAVLLLVALARRASPFPRWTLLALPAWWFLALKLATPFVPAPLGSIVGGSAANLSFTVLFTFLWLGGPGEARPAALGACRRSAATPPNPQQLASRP